MKKIISRSAEETFRAGERLGYTLDSGDIVALYGELGAGKTVFAKGIAAGLGITEEITSPTFTFLKEYEGKKKLYHFDLYRIEDEEALENIGFFDYLLGGGICVIEWPEKAALPTCIRVTLEGSGGDDRTITIERANDDVYTGC